MLGKEPRGGAFFPCFLDLRFVIRAGVEIRQRAEIGKIQTRMDLAELASRREAALRQQMASAMRGTQEARKELDGLRRQLARILPDVERLQTIENMMDNLPRLLRTLARNISDDVVLEVVRNGRSGGVGDIMVVGWTNSYSSAQDFALRVQGSLARLGYSVAQTDVRAGDGREGSPGHFVSFWLVPRAQAEELGLEEGGAATAEPEAGSPAVVKPEGGE